MRCSRVLFFSNSVLCKHIYLYKYRSFRLSPPDESVSLSFAFVIFSIGAMRGLVVLLILVSLRQGLPMKVKSAAELQASNREALFAVVIHFV